MLMSQAFMSLLRSHDRGELTALDTSLVCDCIPLALFQALSRTLQLQNEDGSWSSPPCREVTAYSLLTIAAIATMPFAYHVEREIVTAIDIGRTALVQLVASDISPEYLWIEKVAYSSMVLNETYVLAALSLTSTPTVRLDSAVGSDTIEIKKVEKFVPFYQKLLTIGTLPAWRIRISLLEGCLFGPLLRKVRFEVFPARDLGGKEETYWDNIRFTWCCVNNLDCTFASAEFLVNWMTISYLNYQADEYMEAVVATRFSHDWDAVHRLIDDVYNWEEPAPESDQEHPPGCGNMADNTDHAINAILNDDDKSFTHSAPERTLLDPERGDEQCPIIASKPESVQTQDPDEIYRSQIPVSATFLAGCSKVPDCQDESKLETPKTPPTQAATWGQQLTPPESCKDADAEQKLTQDEIDLGEIRRVLELLDKWTFTHPRVIKASKYHLKETKHEMKMWIRGHLIQAEDSHRLAHQKTLLPFETPASNFYQWVSHVSADHTSVSSPSTSSTASLMTVVSVCI